ncbi:hypothetical protein CIB48_g8822 [Xylaria polymorpha]|nr:hypothetical protein CIB48_g8822 [Xylaria polymorpha]
MPEDSGVNRFASTASTSTTRANRGSPPPPETPRRRAGQHSRRWYRSAYGPQQQQQQQHLATSQPPRPWTPTETPDQQPHGPPTVYQGANPVTSPTTSSFSPQATTRPPTTNAPQNSNATAAAAAAGGPALQVSVLEQDFQRMQMSPSPPPAYSSITPSGNPAGYPNEKQRPAAAVASTGSTPAQASNPASPPPKKASEIAAGLTSPALQHPGHPAFANDPRPESQPSGQPAQATPPATSAGPAATTAAAGAAAATTTTILHTPSPVPKRSGPDIASTTTRGWIAHLDQNSGQYYYIHLATQATQWEFPKGPNPIHHEVAPLSPTASTYGNPLASPIFGKQSAMASPMFPPQTPGYAESIMSVATATPSAAGFSGPPPGAGVDMYKVQPTNGVYFGPYLRYVNMEVEKGLWLGSIMIVTDAPQPPTIHIHPSTDLSPNPRQLLPRSVYTHQRWQFYKYDVDLPMADSGTERWTYAVTSHLGCTRYEFVVAGRGETGWRFVAHSGNDFAAGTSQNERGKLGGLGFMWKDVLQKNVDCGGFHVQLGLGDQIYGDRLWKEVPLLKQWLATPGKENRKNAAWTARHEEDVTHAYFHFYTSHFDQPFLREAFAQIPHICQLDDHDIFDGYGSYPDYMQNSQVFKNIGRIAVDMYLLFQHHTTLEMLRNVGHDMDLFTITGAGVALRQVPRAGRRGGGRRRALGADAEPRARGPDVPGPVPQGGHAAAERAALRLDGLGPPRVPPARHHGVPGQHVTSSVAGIVGGKEVVASGFNQVKKAVGKSGLMGNVVNQFGDLDIGEILKDMWTHDTKDLERTYLIRTLQGIAHQKGIRMTFLSGGLVHDPSHPSDHKTMYQIITSPIVAAPAANYILKMLQHSNKAHYVPPNGQKSSSHDTAITDTKEDMMEIFHTDASGSPRELKKLMGRRNYVAVVAYDPEAIAATQYAASIHSGNAGLSKLSLAVDFVVQGDGAFTAPTKYGPVIVPHLEFGRNRPLLIVKSPSIPNVLFGSRETYF